MPLHGSALALWDLHAATYQAIALRASSMPLHGSALALWDLHAATYQAIALRASSDTRPNASAYIFTYSASHSPSFSGWNPLHICSLCIREK